MTLTELLTEFPSYVKTYKAPSNLGAVLNMHHKVLDAGGVRTAAFFVDLYPGYGWSHPCLYVFQRPCGSFEKKQCSWPPTNWDDWAPVERE
jgi:hypothetical protein